MTQNAYETQALHITSEVIPIPDFIQRLKVIPEINNKIENKIQKFVRESQDPIRILSKAIHFLGENENMIEWAHFSERFVKFITIRILNARVIYPEDAIEILRGLSYLRANHKDLHPKLITTLLSIIDNDDSNTYTKSNIILLFSIAYLCINLKKRRQTLIDKIISSINDAIDDHVLLDQDSAYTVLWSMAKLKITINDSNASLISRLLNMVYGSDESYMPYLEKNCLNTLWILYRIAVQNHPDMKNNLTIHRLIDKSLFYINTCGRIFETQDIVHICFSLYKLDIKFSQINPEITNRLLSHIKSHYEELNNLLFNNAALSLLNFLITLNKGSLFQLPINELLQTICIDGKITCVITALTLLSESGITFDDLKAKTSLLLFNTIKDKIAQINDDEIISVFNIFANMQLNIHTEALLLQNLFTQLQHKKNENNPENIQELISTLDYFAPILTPLLQQETNVQETNESQITTEQTPTGQIQEDEDILFFPDIQEPEFNSELKFATTATMRRIDLKTLFVSKDKPEEAHQSEPEHIIQEVQPETDVSKKNTEETNQSEPDNIVQETQPETDTSEINIEKANQSEPEPLTNHNFLLTNKDVLESYQMGLQTVIDYLDDFENKKIYWNDLSFKMQENIFKHLAFHHTNDNAFYILHKLVRLKFSCDQQDSKYELIQTIFNSITATDNMSATQKTQYTTIIRYFYIQRDEKKESQRESKISTQTQRETKAVTITSSDIESSEPASAPKNNVQNTEDVKVLSESTSIIQNTEQPQPTLEASEQKSKSKRKAKRKIKAKAAHQTEMSTEEKQTVPSIIVEQVAEPSNQPPPVAPIVVNKSMKSIDCLQKIIDTNQDYGTRDRDIAGIIRTIDSINLDDLLENPQYLHKFMFMYCDVFNRYVSHSNATTSPYSIIANKINLAILTIKVKQGKINQYLQENNIEELLNFIISCKSIIPNNVCSMMVYETLERLEQHFLQVMTCELTISFPSFIQKLKMKWHDLSFFIQQIFLENLIANIDEFTESQIIDILSQLKTIQFQCTAQYYEQYIQKLVTKAQNHQNTRQQNREINTNIGDIEQCLGYFTSENICTTDFIDSIKRKLMSSENTECLPALISYLKAITLKLKRTQKFLEMDQHNLMILLVTSHYKNLFVKVLKVISENLAIITDDQMNSFKALIYFNVKLRHPDLLLPEWIEMLNLLNTIGFQNSICNDLKITLSNYFISHAREILRFSHEEHNTSDVLIRLINILTVLKNFGISFEQLDRADMKEIMQNLKDCLDQQYNTISSEVFNALDEALISIQFNWHAIASDPDISLQDYLRFHEEIKSEDNIVAQRQSIATNNVTMFGCHDRSQTSPIEEGELTYEPSAVSSK